MENKLFLQILFITRIGYCILSLPDLSWDTKTEDILYLMNQSDEDYIRSVRYDTEDMPMHCRPDLCLEKETDDFTKGDITWPDTPVGERVYIRCPYAVEDEVYAHYDCVLDENKNATWAAEVITVDCPGPPLYELVLELIQNNTLNNFSVFEAANDLESIHRVIMLYTDTPVLRLEPIYITDLITQVLQMKNHSLLSRHLLGNVMDISDFLLMKNALSDVQKNIIVNRFTTLADTLHLQQMLVGSLMSSLKNRLIFVAYNLKPGHMEDVIDFAGFELQAKFFRDGQKTIVVMLFELSLYPKVLKGEEIKFERATKAPRRVIVEEMDIIRIGTPSVLKRALRHNNKEAIKSLTISEEREKDSTSLSLDHPGFISFMAMNYNQIYHRFFFVSGSFFSEDGIPGELVYTIPHSEKLSGIACASINPLTAYMEKESANETNLLDTWYITNLCQEANVTLNATTCLCQLEKGYYGMTHGFIEESKTSISILTVFLGFPYILELHIVGHVLRAISVFCLLLTLLSHLVFPKTRRGRPTHILINLCISLLLLIIVLYIAEVTAHTKTGCQVANVLRYYLVMVSLLWNGVEAYNMYLMLIKVFNQHSHRLVTKAAVVSWGFPGVLIAIVYAADQKGFKGGYVDCTFRCYLPEKTLYFAYLLPMCIIILHNLVIFGMVVKVLVSSPMQLSASKNDGRAGHSGYWRQLIGAIAMLVLLGVPWLFSAFRAVDHDASNAMKITEAAFQIVFVIFVNMQGLFIFVFHCARNVDVRREWKSAFSSANSHLTLATRSTALNSSLADRTMNNKQETKERSMNSTHGSRV